MDTTEFHYFTHYTFRLSIFVATTSSTLAAVYVNTAIAYTAYWVTAGSLEKGSQFGNRGRLHHNKIIRTNHALRNILVDILREAPGGQLRNKTQSHTLPIYKHLNHYLSHKDIR